MPDRPIAGPAAAQPHAPAPDPALDAAWRALRDGGRVQTRLRPVDPPPQPPEWLKALVKALDHALGTVFAPIGRLFHWLGTLLPDAPWARILFWGWLGALLLLFGWVLVDRLRQGTWRWPRWRRRRAADDGGWDMPEPPVPAFRVTQAWLDEADRLAGEGRYGEALHSLLLRSIEDLARRRPQLVRPAMTARDLARDAEIPEPGRAQFAEIASAVEASLFGGRPMAVADWQRGRAAYGAFAHAWFQRRRGR